MKVEINLIVLYCIVLYWIRKKLWLNFSHIDQSSVNSVFAVTAFSELGRHYSNVASSGDMFDETFFLISRLSHT